MGFGCEGGHVSATCSSGMLAWKIVRKLEEITAGARAMDLFRVTWASACRAARVAGLLFHDLRRTAARNLRRAGIAEDLIMEIGGWRTNSVFKRYAIVSHSDLADAMRKLEAENGHSFGHSGRESGAVAEPKSVQ